MQAEIIAIGDEILIGQTIDTNSSFIANQLNLIGVEVRQKKVIADTKEAIVSALDDVLPETQLVFMTGGLGPTKDDITKKTLTGYFGGELEFHDDVYDNIVRIFKSFNKKPSEVNKSQAYLPSSCDIVFNEIGTASGMRFSENNTYYFSLPGVPYETEYLVSKKIIPWIAENVQKGTAHHKTVLTQGVPESELAEMIEAWENNLPDELKLAYLPSAGMVKLRISSYNLSKEDWEEILAPHLTELHTILGDIIFGQDAQTLEEVVGLSLKAKSATLSTAESCTGGYIAHLLTSIPGSSTYFMGSVVSYANKAKEDLLGVDSLAIKENGAVSKPVVMQMAQEARAKFNTDFAIATSGIAGPDGGTPTKPVGTIWVAVATPKEVKARMFSFGKNRKRNIRKTALMALDLLRREVQKFEP